MTLSDRDGAVRAGKDEDIGHMSPITNPYASGAITREIAEPLTSKEWLALAYLAVKAAEEARANDNVSAEKRYIALARKCDREAEALW